MTDSNAREDAPLLEAAGLTSQRPDGKLVLDVVSLSVRAGEIYCLLGTSGAGKTALLHTFLGFATPSAGTIHVAGIDAAREPIRARRHVTYVAKGASLYGSLTARENLEFFTRVDGRGTHFSRNDCYNAMRRVGIPERRFERPARTLDAGVLLRLWLAIGLLKDTPVLLFDEPTTGLDLYLSAELQETLLALRAQGKAILIATTDILLAGRVADRVGIMKEGRKSIELTQQELVGRPLHDVYLQYVGIPMPRHRLVSKADGETAA